MTTEYRAISDDELLVMRELFESGVSLDSLAEKFGVPQDNIAQAMLNAGWQTSQSQKAPPEPEGGTTVQDNNMNLNVADTDEAKAFRRERALKASRASQKYFRRLRSKRAMNAKIKMRGNGNSHGQTENLEQKQTHPHASGGYFKAGMNYTIRMESFRQAIDRSGMSYNVLSKASGVAPSYISCLYNGHGSKRSDPLPRPTPRVALALAGALKVSPADIFILPVGAEEKRQDKAIRRSPKKAHGQEFKRAFDHSEKAGGNEKIAKTKWYTITDHAMLIRRITQGGWQRGQIAMRVGVNSKTVGKMLLPNKTRRYRSDNIEALAQALFLKPTDFASPATLRPRYSVTMTQRMTCPNCGHEINL